MPFTQASSRDLLSVVSISSRNAEDSNDRSGGKAAGGPIQDEKLQNRPELRLSRLAGKVFLGNKKGTATAVLALAG
jgi:hypothetical protein